MKIETGDHLPIKLCLYRTPIHKREFAEEAVKDMLGLWKDLARCGTFS